MNDSALKVIGGVTLFVLVCVVVLSIVFVFVPGSVTRSYQSDGQVCFDIPGNWDPCIGHDIPAARAQELVDALNEFTRRKGD